MIVLKTTFEERVINTISITLRAKLFGREMRGEISEEVILLPVH